MRAGRQATTRASSGLVAFAVLAGLLLAAAGAVIAPATPAAAAQGETVRLKVYNYFDATSPGAQRELDAIWAAFQRANPDIIIEREDMFGEPFHQKLEAYVAANQLPDVMYLWPGGRSSTLHTKRLIKDLRPFLGDEAQAFHEAALAPQAGGYLGVIPIGLTATHVLYVNKALLDSMGLAIPTTYEELKAMVPALRAAGKDVILMGAQDDWVVQSTLFSMIVGRLAGDEFLAKVLAGEARFTDEPFLKALRFYKSLFDDGVLSRRIFQTAYNEVNGLFASGQAPFMVDGDWKVGNFLTDPTTGEALIPPERQHQIVMTVFPAIPGEINHGTSSTVVGAGYAMSAAIPAGSAKERAAWRLIHWLTSPEAQLVRLETGAAFPSRKGVTSDRLEPLAQERVKFYGRIGGTRVLDDVFEAQVYGPLNVGLQEIGLGLATPEEVAARVQRAMDAWLAARR